MHPLGPPDVVHHDPCARLQSRGQLRPLRQQGGPLMVPIEEHQIEVPVGSKKQRQCLLEWPHPEFHIGPGRRPVEAGLGQCGQARTSFEPHIPASIAGPERHAHGPSPQAGPQLEDVDWTIGPSCALHLSKGPQPFCLPPIRGCRGLQCTQGGQAGLARRPIPCPVIPNFEGFGGIRRDPGLLHDAPWQTPGSPGGDHRVDVIDAMGHRLLPPAPCPPHPLPSRPRPVHAPQVRPSLFLPGIGAVSSVGSEHLVYTERAGGSSPSPPTTFRVSGKPPGNPRHAGSGRFAYLYESVE